MVDPVEEDPGDRAEEDRVDPAADLEAPEWDPDSGADSAVDGVTDLHLPEDREEVASTVTVALVAVRLPLPPRWLL